MKILLKIWKLKNKITKKAGVLSACFLYIKTASALWTEALVLFGSDIQECQHYNACQHHADNSVLFLCQFFFQEDM